MIVVSPPGSPKPLLAEGLGLADILKLSLSWKNLVLRGGQDTGKKCQRRAEKQLGSLREGS